MVSRRIAKQRPKARIPVFAVVFLPALGLLLYFSDILNPRFKKQVTVTNAFPGAMDGDEHPLTLPAAAIQEDNGDTFVLVAVKRAGGKTWRVKRTDVTVQARDGAVTAVSGEVSGFDNIITRPFSDNCPEETELVIIRSR